MTVGCNSVRNWIWQVKPTFARLYMKVYYEHNISATGFDYSCGHSQGDVLHRMDISRYYNSLRSWAQM